MTLRYGFETPTVVYPENGGDQVFNITVYPSIYNATLNFTYGKLSFITHSYKYCIVDIRHQGYRHIAYDTAEVIYRFYHVQVSGKLRRNIF